MNCPVCGKKLTFWTRFFIGPIHAECRRPQEARGGSPHEQAEDKQIPGRCPKCQRTAFPVRLACVNCNETLPGVPHAFESPENRRKKPKTIICRKCSRTAVDARIACRHCDHSLPRPFSLLEGMAHELEDNSEIGRYEIVCSEGACEECMKHDGKEVSREEMKKGVVPISSCRYPVCWCTTVGIHKDEGKIVTD
jgi:hypothetical protein